jgi:hypothetical protein
VGEEGPVVYRTEVAVPRRPSCLWFHGVSYAAEVRVDGALVAEHRGIWDGFATPLDGFEGKTVEVEVTVTKNGGPTYPVGEVASGFLPYLHHTFGGIYRPVELVEATAAAVEREATQAGLSGHTWLEGRRLQIMGAPFAMRGILHWGWYPELGHPNPPEETVCEEVEQICALGFNLVKFCLWVPPHHYLEILAEMGLRAWLELPVWAPAAASEGRQAAEIERIVRQYRRHENIVAWTVGCELGSSVSAEFRERMYGTVKTVSGSLLVADSSGGAEMYGGDPREFGDFYDFHPYCDLPFFPPVLDALLPGAREKKPTFLGETVDSDVHRDLARLGDEIPYWASALPELNARGVRWQYDLPEVLTSNRFSLEPTKNRHRALMESSRRMALFVRKHAVEAIRAREEIGGYVLTGLRDTPISSAGFFDDWGEPRFSPEECESWNGPGALFLIPNRVAPWVNGGNRPGYRDPLNVFAGPVAWKFGAAVEGATEAQAMWTVRSEDGEVAARGFGPWRTRHEPGTIDVAEAFWDARPGEYRLEVEFGGFRNAWPLWVVERPDWPAGWERFDPRGRLGDWQGEAGENLVATAVPPALAERLERGGSAVLLLDDEFTRPMPFWREAAYEFRNEEFWRKVPFAERWSRLLPISPDRALDLPALMERLPSGAEAEVLLNRIDTRTYREDPVLVRIRLGDATLIATTLRPDGGLGAQPPGLAHNAAGSALLRALMAVCQGASPDCS